MCSVPKVHATRHLSGKEYQDPPLSSFNRPSHDIMPKNRPVELTVQGEGREHTKMIIAGTSHTSKRHGVGPDLGVRGSKALPTGARL